MKAEDRRTELIDIISSGSEPVSGTELAGRLGVSRQVIVTDIAVIRAGGVNIISTSKGYVLGDSIRKSRVFAVSHTDEQLEDELNTIVDFGGTVVDVSVDHKVYGHIHAKLGISSRRQVAQFVRDIKSGKSTPLMKVTGGEHFHTVAAESTQILDEIQTELKKKGYLTTILPA